MRWRGRSIQREYPTQLSAVTFLAVPKLPMQSKLAEGHSIQKVRSSSPSVVTFSAVHLVLMRQKPVEPLGRVLGQLRGRRLGAENRVPMPLL